MQNRYVGDVADFGKHGLLRFLSGMTDEEKPDQKLKLGLVWYMHHDEQHGANPNKIAHDGRFINYLKPDDRDDRENYRVCDRELWLTLHQMVVHEEARCVHCVQKRGILPDKTLYFDAMLHYPAYMPKPNRERMRELWLASALQATNDAQLVCVDPDNGIGDPAQMHQKKGPKFTYMSDLKELWDRGKSLVIYQHLGMIKGGAEVMIPATAAKIKDGLGVEPIPLWFHRGSARVFFVVPNPKCKGHKELIEDRVSRFLERGWREQGHFER